MKSFIKNNLSLLLAIVIFIVGTSGTLIITYALTSPGEYQTSIKKTKVPGDSTVGSGDDNYTEPDWFDKDYTADNKVTSLSNELSTGVTAEGVKTYKNRYDKILDEEGFIYGINIPWFGAGAQGHNLSYSKTKGYPASFDDKLVYADLYNCKAIGFSAINIWLSEGIAYDSKGYVTGLEDDFIENFGKLLNYIRQLDVGVTFTIQCHLDTYAKGNYGHDKSTYDFFAQMYTDTAIRDSYIKNAVIPILKMIKPYESNLVSFYAFCEPEMDIYTETNSFGWGTNRKTMNAFISVIRDACKDIFPNVPVGVATLQNVAHEYNDLGLDFVGYDVYNDEGDVPAISDQMSTTPMFLTEFGTSNTKMSQENQSAVMYNMFQNAKSLGYVGAYYWCYDGDNLAMVEPYTQSGFRVSVSTAHYIITDNKYEQAGILYDETVDTPVMLAFEGETLMWFGSRQAYAYRIERSPDGKNWTVIEDAIPQEEVDLSGLTICSYNDYTKDYLTPYYYRITSLSENGTAVSNVSDEISYWPITCSEEKNLVKNGGFENGTYNGWKIVGDSTLFSVASGNEESETNTGAHSLHINGVVTSSNRYSYIEYEVECEKNTDYTYTFSQSNPGYNSSSLYKINDQNGKPIVEQMNFIRSGSWNRTTVRFNSGDAAKIKISYVVDVGRDYFGTAANLYVDDIYLFKTKG